MTVLVEDCLSPVDDRRSMLVSGNSIFCESDVSNLIGHAAGHSDGESCFAIYIKDQQAYDVVAFDAKGQAGTVQNKSAWFKPDEVIAGLTKIYSKQGDGEHLLDLLAVS